MQKNILEKWQDLNQVYIPPLETRGFTENVLYREIWKRQESKAEKEPVEDDITVLLTAEEPAERAYIIRTATNERIDLDKDEISIGKSAKADYQIHGNDAISRIHIKIIKTEEGYQMEDQDSLNHTYLDDQEISSPVILEHGWNFKLADEEFCFFLEKGEA